MRPLVLLAVLAALLLPCLPGAALRAEEGHAVGCSFCGHPPCPPWHYPSCPLYRGSKSSGGGGGGGGGGGPQLTPEQSLNLMAPLGIPLYCGVGVMTGFVSGAKWLWKGLGGQPPNYFKYVDEKGLCGTLSRMPEIGWQFQLPRVFAWLAGSPFAALYGAGWCVVQGGKGAVWCGRQTGRGAAWCGRQIAAPFKPPPPPPPSAEQHAKIAAAYGLLEKESEARRARVAALLAAAEERRRRFLDEFIAARPKLAELAAKEGREAACARAAKALDAYVAARDRRREVAADLAAAAGELQALEDAALARMKDHATQYVLWERPFDVTEAALKARLARGWKEGGLAAGQAFDLSQEMLRVRDLEKLPAAEKLPQDLDAVRRSWRESAAAGGSFKDWALRPQTRERLGRLALGCLGSGGVAAERSMDASYLVSAKVLLSGRIARMQEDAVRLSGERWYQDAYAADWARLGHEREAWRRSEVNARTLRNFYAGKRREHEQRSGGR